MIHRAHDQNLVKHASEESDANLWGLFCDLDPLSRSDIRFLYINTYAAWCYCCGVLASPYSSVLKLKEQNGQIE